MKIKILSDSTCDLSKALLEENDITLVPLTVIKNDEQFKDGVTITPDPRRGGERAHRGRRSRPRG